MPTRYRRLALASLLLPALLAGTACQRGPTPAGDAASGDDAAATGDATAEVDAPASAGARSESPEAYYARLEAEHGQDYASCGESQRVEADTCPAGDAPGAKPGQRSNVLLMLDASGSMAGRVGGETKMAAAQDALIGFSRKLSGNADVALRVYGHTGSNDEAGKATSCAGSALLVPFAKHDAAAFESAIRGFRPTGWTPIATSLEAAAADFAKAPAKNAANVVYVVSDGIETCGGDPVAAARALHDSAIDVVVNVIGFDVDAEAARQLSAVAKAGGGDYLVADDGAALRDLLNRREAEVRGRYNCIDSAQRLAFNRTDDLQRSRANCIDNKARAEANAIDNAVRTEFNRIEADARHRARQAEDAAREAAREAIAEIKADDAPYPEQRDAEREANDVRNAAEREARDERDRTLDWARTRRDYAQAQSRLKRDRLTEEARAVRDANIGDARLQRDTTLGSERADRDRALEDVRRDREAERQH